MAGEGRAPFRSSWLLSGSINGTGSMLLRSQLRQGDVNSDEGTMWRAWFFPQANSGGAGGEGWLQFYRRRRRHR